MRDERSSDKEVHLPSVRPSLVHWTLPARSPITQLMMARPPSPTKESCGVVRKNCCLDPALWTITGGELELDDALNLTDIDGVMSGVRNTNFLFFSLI